MPLGAAPVVIQVPAETGVVVSNVQTLLRNALEDAGIIGIDESPEQPIINRALRQANWLIAQWARKRWLCYRIQDYSFVSTGALTYAVGAGQPVNISPRPDRLEYAFLRFLNGAASGNLPVDIKLDIISSHEDYSLITVKTVGTLPWRVFYDPAWPNGLLFPWPVPQATLYEIHVGFKVVLPRFVSLQQSVAFPPEYEAALNWCLVRRLMVSYQMPMNSEVNALARDGLNTIRLANSAMSTLSMPRELVQRNRAYDYRGDDAGY
jgi:hypothetical protein